MSRDVIAQLLLSEGGFVDHPNDRGDATNFGITQATLAWWRKHPVTVEDVRNLTQAEAAEILTEQYINAPGFADLNIPDYLRHQIIDYGVNSGPGLVTLKLQDILHLTPDGDLGPITKAAIEGADPAELNNRLVIARLLMLGRLVMRDKSQVAFIYGWIDRACKFFILG